MITNEQRIEILRLAGLLSTRRVRRFAAVRGVAGPEETIQKTTEQAHQAQSALDYYLTTLTLAQ